MWDATKAILREKSGVLNVYVEKKERFNFYLNRIEKQTKSKANRRKKIIKIWAESNKIEKRQTLADIYRTKWHFFVKINKNDKLLAKVTEIKET